MDVKLIIDRLGGVQSAADFFEITPEAIYFWIKTEKIPKARLLHLRAVRPDAIHPQNERVAA